MISNAQPKSLGGALLHSGRGTWLLFFFAVVEVMRI